MQKNRQSCPHYLWSQLQMVHLETLPDLKRRRLWNKKIKKGRSIFLQQINGRQHLLKERDCTWFRHWGPSLRRRWSFGRWWSPRWPRPARLFFFNQFWIQRQLVGGGGQGTLGGSAGVGESLSPGRGARAGGDIPRDWAPELSWNNFDLQCPTFL